MGKPEVECAGAHESNAVRRRWSLITDHESLITDHYSLPPWPRLLGAWAKPLRPQLRKGAWLPRSFTLSSRLGTWRSFTSLLHPSPAFCYFPRSNADRSR